MLNTFFFWSLKGFLAGLILLCVFFHCFSGTSFLYTFCMFVCFTMDSYFVEPFLWEFSEGVFLQERLAFGCATYVVGSFYIKFSVWSFHTSQVLWLWTTNLYEGWLVATNSQERFFPTPFTHYRNLSQSSGWCRSPSSMWLLV